MSFPGLKDIFSLMTLHKDCCQLQGHSHIVIVASFRASNILFMSAYASFILSSDGCVGPAFKLNSEVFCSLISEEFRVNLVKSILLLLYASDTSVINKHMAARKGQNTELQIKQEDK